MLRIVGLWGALAFVLVVAACKQAPSEEPPLDSRVHLYLTDFPINDVEIKRVLVTFTHVDVYSAERQQWLTVVDYGEVGRQFDLLTLQNGRTEELGAFDLEPGTYEQIRLHLTPDHFIEVDDGSGPTMHPLKIPSGDQTGIKIVRSFTVTRQGPTELTVDFDAQRSVHHTRGQGYILRPTIKLVSISTPDSFAKLIHAATGGEVHLIGKAELKIPPNALAQDTLIEIRELELTESYTDKVGLLPSSIIELEPSGLTFQTPAELRIFFDPDEIPAGQTPQDLTVLSQSDGQGWAQHASTVSSTPSASTALISHLGGSVTAANATNSSSTPPRWGSGSEAKRLCLVDPETNIEHCEPLLHKFNCKEEIYRSANVYANEENNSADPIRLRHRAIVYSSIPENIATVTPSGTGCADINDKAMCDMTRGCGYDDSIPKCIVDAGQIMITRPGCGTASVRLQPTGSDASVEFPVTTSDPYRFILDRIEIHDDCDDFPSGDGEMYWKFVIGNDVAIFDHPNEVSAGSGDTIHLSGADRVMDKMVCGRPPFIIGGFLADEDGGANARDDVSSFSFGFRGPGPGSDTADGCPDDPFMCCPKGTFHWDIKACSN